MAALKAIMMAALLAQAAPAAAGDPVERWSAHIGEASARFAVPADWIRHVIRAESGGLTMIAGRPIVSRAGAMGLMQLMPGTWRDMRSRLGLGPDPHDPHDNILAGTFYLRMMYDRFGYPGLFAAYNAGPARYGTYVAKSRALPAETRAYAAGLAAATSRVAEAPGRPPLLFAVLAAAGPAPPGLRPLERRPATLFVALGEDARP